MNTCKGCTWWNTVEECKNPEVLSMIHAEDAVYFEFTPPYNFGCIHHEPTEKKDAN